MQALLFRKAFEEQARKKRDKQEEEYRLQERIIVMKKQIEELEAKQRSAQNFLLFMETLKSELHRVTPIRINPHSMTPIVTTEQFNRQLKEKAQVMRMQVPSIYRPNFKLTDSKKKDNGGLARPPPKMTSAFNQASGVRLESIKVNLNIQLK